MRTYTELTMYVLMPRPRLYNKARRVTIYICSEQHEQASKRAYQMGLRGGFSELVARLIAHDSKRKGRVLRQQLRAA